MAILVVHIGNENTFHELLQIPSYYSDLLLALISAMGIGYYFRFLFNHIQHRFTSDRGIKARVIFQALFGLFIPTLTLAGIEIFYLVFLLKIDLADSSVFYLELPVIFIFCLLINLIYVLLYVRMHNKALSDQLKKEQAAKIPSPDVYLSTFVVYVGARIHSVPEDEVAYFIIKDKSTYLVTTGGNQYLYNTSLELLNKKVSPKVFFQLNRQIIAHRKSLGSFEQTETRKLKVQLFPIVEEDVYISKLKATTFLKWLQQS